MSSRKRTCKRPCYRGDKDVRRAYWAGVRRGARMMMRRLVTPDPPRHRHNEKWDRE